MRNNQVSILIERFGEYVPEEYPNNVQRISVYCDDATSIYAALAKANAMAINELNEYESIGVKSYVSTNEYSKSDYREMHGHDPIERNSYEDDLELQFTYKNHELRKDRIWVHENIDEIIKLISSVEDKKTLKTELKDKFGLSDFQIKKLLSVRLDMLSKEDYLSDLGRDKEYETFDKNKAEGLSKVQQIHWCERWIRETRKKLDEYKTYITIADNYQDMLGIFLTHADFEECLKVFKEKYGFDRAQTSLVKTVTIDDLLSVEKYREKAKNTEEELAKQQEELHRIFEQKDKEDISR